MPPEAETGVDSPRSVENGVGRGVGSLLHASRLRCGEDLAGISQILKVRLPYLEAIEEGRFEDLPGNTYAIGFIRAYADYLGLDSGEVVRRYKEDVSDADKKSDLDFPVPVPESGIPGGAILFIGAAIAILTYGGWYASTTKSGFLAELISPVPEKLSSLSVKAEKSGVEKKASPQVTGKDNPAPPPTQDEQSTLADATEGSKAEKAPVAAAKPEPEETALPPPLKSAPEPETDTAQAKKAKTVKTAETPAPVTPPTPPPSEALKTLSTLTPEAPAPSHSEQAAAPPPTPEVTTEAEIQKVTEKHRPEVAAVSIAADTRRIVIRAKTNSWIQIRDGIGNKLVVTRLLRSGDSYRVPDKPGLKLLTGNAGGLEIMVDGETVPVIGGKGAVRRSVVLDADRLLAGTAVAE